MIPVLYYHRVGPFAAGAERKMNVEPGRFQAQMEHLANRCHPVTLDAVLDGAPPRAIAVTFDDGYRDLMEHALPVLRDLRIAATFFIVAGAVGGKDRWYRGEQDIMTWDDLETLKSAGMEIGSHAMTHGRLDQMSEAEARRELVESKRLLEERLGGPVRHLAYPQGGRNDLVKRLAAEAGYRAAWATKSGEGGPYAMKRLRVASDEGMLRFRFKLLKARWGRY